MRVIVAAAALLSLNAFQGPADQSPHTEHLFERDGIQLHYLDWGGQGDLLVFLTGYGATPHVFDGLAGQFRSGFRVVSPTRRGRQPSASPATGYALSDLTADVTALLDRLQVSRVHLVAHSLAGAEATALAIEQPTRIVSIVYLDAALDAAKGEALLAESPAPFPLPAPGTPYALVREWWTKYTPDFSKVPVPTLAFYALPAEPPMQPNTPEDVKARARAFWKARWLPATEDMIDKYRREAKQGRAIVYEGASHYLFRDREADVVGEMREFYRSLHGRQ